MASDDQATYVDKLADAKTVADVDQIVADANAADLAILADAQDEAKATVNALTYLSSDEKTDFENQIANAKTVTDVAAIVAQAKNADVADARVWATNEISALNNLDTDAQQSFVSKLPDAETVATVEQIVADAKVADESALQDAQAEATETIKELTYLSDTDKSAATQTINDATTIADVDNIVADATANNLTNAKASATNEIGKLANLSEGDQTTYT